MSIRAIARRASAIFLLGCLSSASVLSLNIRSVRAMESTPWVQFDVTSITGFGTAAQGSIHGMVQVDVQGSVEDLAGFQVYGGGSTNLNTDISHVRLYLDGSNCASSGTGDLFDPNTDYLLGETGTLGKNAFNGTSYALFSPSYSDGQDDGFGSLKGSQNCFTSVSSTKRFFVAYEIASGATIGDTVALTIKSGGVFGGNGSVNNLGDSSTFNGIVSSPAVPELPPYLLVTLMGVAGYFLFNQLKKDVTLST